MSALAESLPGTPEAHNDYFRALEERVVRVVELLKNEREARAAAEQHAAQLSHRGEEWTAQISRLEEELSGLKNERDGVRQRVERLLKQLDEI